MSDMAKYPRLMLRGNVWQYRVKIPVDLISEYGGKHEIKLSLKTSDRSEALEKMRLHDLRIDSEFAQKRRVKNEQPAAKLSDTEIARLAALWLAHVLEEDEEVRREGLDERHYRKLGEAIDISDIGQGHALARGDTRLMEFEVDDLLESNGIKLDKSSESYRRLSYELLKADVKANEMLQQRHGGKAVDTPAPPVGPVVTPQGLTLESLIDVYMANPDMTRRSGKTKTGYTVIFRVLKELLGSDKPVKTINRADCRKVRDTLIALPSNATKRFPDTSLEDIAALPPEKREPLISTGTVNSYLVNLSALYNWAVHEEFMERNPAKNLTIEEKPSKRRLPFSLEQLRAIFNAPLYRDPGQHGSGAWWVPLVALYSGMRLNEACQLLTTDVKKIGAVPVFLVRESGDDDEGNSGDKRVKTVSSERIIPIHPMLERLGVLRHWSRMKKAGEARLFPDLPIGANGYYSDVMSKRFNTLLKSVGAKTKMTSFHSFRHTFRDALRHCGVTDPEIVRLLGGWARATDEADRYGSGPLAKMLYAPIKKIRYEGLDLSHLHP